MVRQVLRDPVLLALVATGGALRIVAAADRSRHVSADARAYSLLASDLARHARYGGPGLVGPFHWPPGAPALFAVAKLAGAPPYAAQVVVGTLTIVAAALVAWHMAGRAAGLLAAGVVALYPPLVLSAGELLSEPLGALLLTLAVVAAGRRRLVICGVLLGLTALTRADLLLAPLVLAGVLAALRRSLAPAAVILAAAALTVAPWTIYVASQKGEFVPVSTGGGSNLFIGTYLPGHGTIFGLKRAFAPVLHAHVPAFKVPEEAILRHVARGHRGNGEDAYLRDRGLRNAWHYVTHQPADFGGMLATKIGRLWLDYTHGTLHRSRVLPRIGHVLLLTLALIALIAGLRVRRTGEGVCIAALLVLSTVVNAVLVSEARHLLPLLPLLFAGGAGGAVLALHRRSGRLQSADPSMSRP